MGGTRGRKNELIYRLYKALDDEVQYCIYCDNNISVSEISIDLLRQCEQLGYGESVALKKLKKEK